MAEEFKNRAQRRLEGCKIRKLHKGNANQNSKHRMKSNGGMETVNVCGKVFKRKAIKI